MRSGVVLEVKTAVEAEHEFFEEGDISLGTGEDIVLGDAVHTTGDEVHDENAAVIRYIADEVFAVHKGLILHII